MANAVKLSVRVCEELQKKKTHCARTAFFIPCKRREVERYILRAALSSPWWVLHMPLAVAVPWNYSPNAFHLSGPCSQLSWCQCRCKPVLPHGIRVTTTGPRVLKFRLTGMKYSAMLKRSVCVRAGREMEEELLDGWVKNEEWWKQLIPERKRLGPLCWGGFFYVWELLDLWRIQLYCDVSSHAARRGGFNSSRSLTKIFKLPLYMATGWEENSLLS